MSQQINLYNPVFLKQRHYFSALTMVQALAIVLVGSLGIYSFEVRQNVTLERSMLDTDKQVATQREQLLRYSKEFSVQGASRALADQLGLTEERMQRRSALLEDLKTGVGGNAEGFSRYLRALARQVMPGVWLTGLEIGGKQNDILIKGRALESQLVPAYIRSLNREEPMAGRPVAELRLTSKGDATRAPAAGEPSRYIEFSLSLPLKGGS